MGGAVEGLSSSRNFYICITISMPKNFHVTCKL